jgi:DNA polymerase-3 subunit gamma/tau
VSVGLALKYRPRRFQDLVGQRHVSAVLRELVKAGSPPQQLLLSGGSGLGKTTVARIFAAALLCENPQDGDACGACVDCDTVTLPSHTHPDVI